MEPITKVNIDGTALNAFSNVNVVQKMYDHHSFKIVVGHEIIEELGGHTLDKSKDWIGKIAVITFGESDFVGLVTSVNMVHNHGLFGDLVISGYSPTILMESGEHFCSWTDKALRDIMDETISISGIKNTVKPKYSETIGYLCQYRESHFAFLRRIACEYNEWMFYDGEKLLFGEPSSIPEIPLLYGTDVDNVQVSIRIRPVKFDAFSYHSLRDEQVDGTTQDSVSGLDDLGNHAFKAAKENFAFNGVLYADPRIPNKGSLDDVLKNRQSAAAANLSTTSGNSTKQELRPGVIADLKVNLHDSGSLNSKPFGKYLVTAVHHNATGLNGYSNYFEAIPSGVKVLPEPNIKRPMAFPQIATVLSNEDPDKKGRVQIQTQWQILAGLNSNWIRVMTPDAGVSDKVGANRGSVFIPEAGDQVMVGFRYGDPSRPFVMGSMFNGMTGIGGDSNNKIKSITTRSGSTITFDDDEGDGMIVISDPSGNVVVMDGAGGISMTAPKTISISAGESISISSQEIAMHGSKNVAIAATNELNLSGETTGIGASKSMTVQGKTVGVMGKKSLSLEALATTVNGTTSTHIQGGLVNIN